MKKTRSIFVLVLLVSLLLAIHCSEPPRSGSITILHTNDIHGAFLPSPATWIKTTPKPEIGGFLALNHYIQQIQSQIPNTLLLDAGDFMTGNLICNIDYQGAKGGALVHFLNQVGCEGLTLGNHEFDISHENIQNLIKIAQFPVYSANLYQDGKLFIPNAYHIYQKGNLRIGVIGIITEQLFDVLNAKQRIGLEVKKNAEVVESIAREIDDQTDLIIVLSHCGFREDKELAKKLSRRIDVIVGGHSHTRLKQPKRVNGILIVQAGAKARNLGQLDITVAGDTVQSYAGKLISLWVEGITKEPALEQEINKFKELIDAQYGQVIAQLKTDWRRARHAESSVGNFLADCMREYTETDVAFINSGGIRKNMASGAITIRDIMEMLPFENYIYTFEATGSELIETMKINARKMLNKKGGILQASGLSFQWKRNANGSIAILNPKINGEKLEHDKKYSGATVDFVVVSNNEKYMGFKPEVLRETGHLFTDVAIEVIKQKKIIDSSVEGRMKQF